MSVHSTHCCKTHGFKYGESDCPVEFGDDDGIECEACIDFSAMHVRVLSSKKTGEK